MKEPIFTGSAVAIITPMNDDCSVNYDEFKSLLIIKSTTAQTQSLFAAQPANHQRLKQFIILRQSSFALIM